MPDPLPTLRRPEDFADFAEKLLELKCALIGLPMPMAWRLEARALGFVLGGGNPDAGEVDP